MERCINKVKKGGVYSIINTFNNKVYIGSSKNVSSRIYIHISDLKLNRHHSVSLQRAFNKYGENSFNFDLVEIVEHNENLITREQVWMDFFKPEYNICKTAYSRLGVSHSEETKIKMRKPKSEEGRLNMKNKVKRTEEHKINLGLALKGKKRSEESKEKIRAYYRTNANWCKGKKMSEEHRKNNSESQKGKVLSQETKDKISKKMKGRKLSKETIDKAQLTKKLNIISKIKM